MTLAGHEAECAACRGTGRYVAVWIRHADGRPDETRTQPCPYCRGEGRVYVGHPAHVEWWPMRGTAEGAQP